MTVLLIGWFVVSIVAGLLIGPCIRKGSEG